MALVLNYLSQGRQIDREAQRRQVQVELDFRVRQLNELYGPLRFLIEQNKRLAGKLREGKPDPNTWRLLDNVDAVLRDPQESAIAREILRIDAEIENLIIQKAGLIIGRPPESFDDFVSHYRLLVLAMDGQPIGSPEYFPRALNDDVKRSWQLLAAQVESLLNKAV